MTPMDKTLPPSVVEVVTTEQLGRAADRFITKCRKNEASLPKNLSQQVLEEEGDQLAQEMFDAFRKRVERRSKMIVRRVTVNRVLTPEQMIEATGRRQYVDKNILETMPRNGAGIEEVDVYFFNPGRYLTIDEQERELAAMGLDPDYYAQIQVNIDDPLFADEHPNGAQWYKKDKQASFFAFSRDGDGRHVGVYRYGLGWDGCWWFAGVRKVS
jgi:hypothetical protein